jgi:hypothetical protein
MHPITVGTHYMCGSVYAPPEEVHAGGLSWSVAKFARVLDAGSSFAGKTGRLKAFYKHSYRVYCEHRTHAVNAGTGGSDILEGSEVVYVLARRVGR